MLQTNGSMIIFGGVNWLSSGLTLGSVFRKKITPDWTLCIIYCVGTNDLSQVSTLQDKFVNPIQ